MQQLLGCQQACPWKINILWDCQHWIYFGWCSHSQCWPFSDILSLVSCCWQRSSWICCKKEWRLSATLFCFIYLKWELISSLVWGGRIWWYDNAMLGWVAISEICNLARATSDDSFMHYVWISKLARATTASVGGGLVCFCNKYFLWQEKLSNIFFVERILFCDGVVEHVKRYDFYSKLKIEQISGSMFPWTLCSNL